MSKKADIIALKGVAFLVCIIVFLFFARSCASDLSLIPSRSAPKASEGTVSLVTIAPPIHSPLPLPQTRKISTPVPIPHRFSMRIIPKHWSKRIDLPEGFTAYVTFKLGRIRIERNGIDEGIWFRQPLADGGPGQINLHPFSVLDRTPRTIVFPSETRTLRFMSGESEAGDIFVEFK